MARIWYSIQGDGMGHALRSNIIMQDLKKNHQLMITTTTKKTYDFLKKKYGSRVHLIKGDEFVYKKNSVLVAKSIKNFFMNLPSKSKSNMAKLSKLILDFQPNIIINDFEPAAHYAAILLRIPCISVDNVHVITECNISKPEDSKLQLTSVRTLIKVLHPTSTYYVITTFANVKPKNKKTFLVKPVIRKEILNLKPKEKDFVLVYQTTSTNKKMLKILEKTKNKHIIYGFKGEKNRKNLVFKQFSEKGFLEDLKNCKYVIVNGGFTVISEAIYLKKPILAIPIYNQFEQEFNAFTIRNRGFGDYTKNLEEFDMEGFELRLPFFKHKLKNYGVWDNSELLKRIEILINKGKIKKPRYELLRSIVPKRW